MHLNYLSELITQKTKLNFDNVLSFPLGHLAGDMMMSVFWYYRPEQTEVGKLAGYHGEVRKCFHVSLINYVVYYSTLTLSPLEGPYSPKTNTLKDNFSGGKVILLFA